MLIIETDLSILPIEWFGKFIVSHGKDTLFMPSSVIIFFDDERINDRKEFLKALAQYYSEKTEFYYEQILKNFLRYRHKPIKIEFKRSRERIETEIYLDAISTKEIKVLLKDENYWIISFYLSQLNGFISEWDGRRLFLNASEARTKNRLDRLLKRKQLLFFNLKYTYSPNFLTILFNTFNSRRNRKNSFNSTKYLKDNTLQAHYSTLEAPYDSDFETIKRNYRKLAKMYHPDRVHNKNETVVELYTKKFQKIQESYNYLKEYLGK
jgi:hypothetical protein